MIYYFKKEYLDLYREVFEDYNKDYRHALDICAHIRDIMRKNINKLTEKEILFRTYMEVRYE